MVSLVIGIIIAFSGLLIMCICILKYFMQLSGLKGLIENRMNNELMITGIHKIVRHPLYSGTFIFIWGLLVIFPVASLLITDTIITIYTLIGLRFEEMKLEKEFGEAYRLYKQNVPMLIPKLVGNRESSFVTRES
jgi:methanethiol S-methyltransferase